MHYNMTLTQEHTIQDLYLNHKISADQIAKQLNVKPYHIYRYLKVKAITRPRGRKRTNLFNQDFFQTIDSHEKAQILGLWYADGNVRIDNINRTGSYSCRIQLAEEDSEYLERINRIIGCTTPLKFIRRARPHYQDSKALILYSRKTYTDLVDKGCIPNKSLILKFPTLEQVPEEFLSSFLLGYFEGDGCVNIYHNKKYPTYPSGTIHIVGTLEFCHEYAKLLKEKLGVHSTIYQQKGITTNNHHLSISGNNQVIKVFDFLYQHSTFCMKRKRDKYLLIKEYMDGKQSAIKCISN